MDAGALRHWVVGSIAGALRGHPPSLEWDPFSGQMGCTPQDRHPEAHGCLKFFRQTIQPDPKEIFLTLTANCNLRCKGCRYGRDFMPRNRSCLGPSCGICWTIASRSGSRAFASMRANLCCIAIFQKLWSMRKGWARSLANDQRHLAQGKDRRTLRGVDTRPEPSGTTEPAKNTMPTSSARIVTLRWSAELLTPASATARSFALRWGWVAMRPTCNVDEIQWLWKFAEKISRPVSASACIHYSLPYFTEGPDQELQFRPEDGAAIEPAVSELIRIKQLRPELIQQSLMALRSIPDWLLKKADMRVPCDRYHLLWVGADGTVQLCYVTFKLGNLHEQRLASHAF